MCEDNKNELTSIMSLLIEKLFSVTQEDIECVRQSYGKSEEEIKSDCDVIQEWMKQQRHFPDDLDLARIERIFLKNKFRIEHTKKKLENYYTIRGARKDFFQNMDPEGEKMKTFLPSVKLVPLPKLFNNRERLYLQRLTEHEKEYSLEINTLLMLTFFEMELMHDYSAGVRIIVDFDDFTMTHLKRMDVNMLSKAFYLFKECLSARIIGLEFVNMPSVMNMILDLFKLALPEKLYKKITVHKDFEALKCLIPEEYLPSDYGGKLRSIDKIDEDVKQFFKENRKYLMGRLDVVTDESKRVGEVIKNDLFGVDGTFKRMNLD